MQQPLTNPELERKLLALAVSHSEAALSIQKAGGEILFNVTNNIKIWQAIDHLLKSKTPIQYVLVRDMLDAKRGRKAAYLEKIVSTYSELPLADASVYIPILADYSERRRLAEIAGEFSSGVFDLSKHTREIKTRLKDSLSEKQLQCIKADKNLYEDLPAIGEALASYKNSDKRICFPFQGVSRVTGSLKPGDLVLLAARPSMGKTTFAINTACHNARFGPVLFFSLEMGKEQIGLKVLASELQLDHTEIQTDKALEWMKNPTGQVGEVLRNLYVFDGVSGSLDSIKSVVFDFLAGGRAPCLVVIDYIQLMGERKESESREKEISIISRGLKLLAKEVRAPILALSQLNRNVEMRGNKTPVLSDLRDSGSLEQDADVVAFLFREEYYKADAIPGLTDVLILKNRMGATGKSTVYLDAEKSRFYEGA